MQTIPNWMTTDEAAEYTRISAFNIRKLCRRGDIKASKTKGDRGNWRISRASLDAYLEGAA